MPFPRIDRIRSNDVARALLRLSGRYGKRPRDDGEMQQRIEPSQRLVHRHMLLRLRGFEKGKSQMKTIGHAAWRSFRYRGQRRGSTDEW